VPYDPTHGDALDIARLRGAACALGIRPSAAAPDVLDIGCGTGSLLLRAAAQSGGRILGIDASATAAARAAERAAGFGPRVEVRHADAASLDPAALGGFDVIYLVGTLFIMPPPIRARVLALAGACLRPGGVLAVTGYTGIIADLLTRGSAILRAANDPRLPPAQQLAHARANLRHLLAAPAHPGPLAEAARGALAALESRNDVNLFHEALSGDFAPLDAVPTAAALAPYGIAFLNLLPPVPINMNGAAPNLAAQAVDVAEMLAGGAYRTLLFARPLQGAPPAGLRDPALRWTTTLRPDGERDGQAAFTDPVQKSGLHTAAPHARAAIAAMIEAPASHADLVARAPAADPALPAQLDDLLLTLWRARLAAPLWHG
jgi:SAM-dependent methyltransferase